MKKVFKKEIGITLVALVITIIILLILTGIAILQLTGENGLIQKAQSSREKYLEAEVKEKIGTLLSEYVIESNSTGKTLEDFLNEQKEKGNIDSYSNNGNGRIIIQTDDYCVVIDKDGNKIERVSKEVEYYVTNISLNNSSINIVEDENLTLVATVLPENATNKGIQWESENEEIATIDNTGKITAIKEGETAIVATAKDGSGIKATASVVVTEKQPITVSENTLKGAYIKYNVEYDEMYGNFKFTSINGWRLLNYTIGIDGKTINNVEIISTGIPAILKYNKGSTENNDWWETNSTKLNWFHNNILGGSSYGTVTTSQPNMQAGAGLYYNFGNIKFAYSTESRGDNLGYFKSIKNGEGITYNSSNTTEVNATKLFVTGTRATGVRLLTLPELNIANGNDTNKTGTGTITDETDPISLYKIITLQLKNNNGESITPLTGHYWLASPGPNSGSSVCTVYGMETGHVGEQYNNILGVRPVISLGDGIKLIQKEDSFGDTYYRMK